MNRLRPPTLSATLAGLVVVLAACGGGAASATDTPIEPESAAPSQASSSAPSEAPAGEETTVRLEGFAFEPAELTIAAGTEVAFVNADGAAHTVTEGENGAATDGALIDEEVAASASTRFTFDEPGTYQITCLFHSSMNLTITVEG